MQLSLSMVVILTSRLISLSIEVCIPPEEVAIATKACGIDIINVRLFVCLSRCPKQQKTKTKDKYENNNEDNDNKDNNNKDKDNRDNNNEDSDKKDNFKRLQHTKHRKSAKLPGHHI